MGYHRPSVPLGSTGGRRAGCPGVNERETQAMPAVSYFPVLMHRQGGWVGFKITNLATYGVAIGGIVKKIWRRA
jgi:hypothetical protein